jgi:hypothetical protein
MRTSLPVSCGNISAGELAKALRKWHVGRAAAQELILSINERHGSQRKDLPLDIFAVTFGAKSQASAAAALSPETLLSRSGAPATSTSSSRKCTTDDSSNVFQVVSAFLHARARSSSTPPRT